MNNSPVQRITRPSVPPGEEPSWWLQEALAAEGNVRPAPALEGEIDVDVAILGGGYTGLWTAILLRERDPKLRIALVEAEICGAGASGKNGGFVHGYWHGIAKVAGNFSDAVALHLAYLGSKAQDAIRAFCTAPGVDVWWRENGIIKISCAPAQDAAIARTIEVARRLGVADKAVPLSPEEVRKHCRSPRFRMGVWMKEAATVQPARLARALRRAALERGVQLFENTPADLRAGSRLHTIVTPRGRIRARHVVLALNAWLTGRPDLQMHLMNFSSFMVITEPVPDLLEHIGWTRGEGLDDARMFVHYFRTTPDGRVAMGSGSGRIGFAGVLEGLAVDDAAVARAETALRRLFPDLADARITHSWGGPIDVSADGLPFFGTLSPGRIHYGVGYSGHGVNATWIGGKILASLVLGEDNEWTQSFFCRRRVAWFPPDPFRTAVGRFVRRAIIASEEAEEDERTPPLFARIGTALPRICGIKVGTR